MSIELVVFAMAGTTVRDGDAVAACLEGALRGAGVRVSHADLMSVMGLPKPVAIRRLIENDAVGAEAEDRLVDTLHEDFVRRMLGHYRSDPAVCEAAGAGDMFRELRGRGIKVALDTGFSRPIVDVILERLGWQAGVLDATVASDEVRRGRPHPDLIWRAMELTGVSDPRHVAKVGDTPFDLEEGRAAGCGLVVGITQGSHTAEQLLPWPHTHLIPGVQALLPLLASTSSSATTSRDMRDRTTAGGS